MRRVSKTAFGRALLGACSLTLAAVSSPDAKAEDAADNGGMAVSVVKALKRCFKNHLSASGLFVPTHEVDLRPDREGLVVSDLFVEPGDVVVEGQVLARLVFPRGPLQEGVAIKAPVRGTVIKSSAVIGAYTSPGGADPLFRIAANSELQLKAELLTSYLADIKEGMPATIHVVGLGDIKGTVASVDRSVDPTTQLASLRLAVPSEAHMHAGGFARADIDAGEDCGLSVPLSALLYESDTAVIGIVRGNRVVMRRVATGLLEGGDIEVRDGLRENDLVIARAGTFVREGDRVRSVPSGP